MNANAYSKAVFTVGDRVVVQGQSVAVIEKIVNQYTVIVRSETTGMTVTVSQGDLSKVGR